MGNPLGCKVFPLLLLLNIDHNRCTDSQIMSLGAWSIHQHWPTQWLWHLLLPPVFHYYWVLGRVWRQASATTRGWVAYVMNEIILAPVLGTWEHRDSNGRVCIHTAEQWTGHYWNDTGARRRRPMLITDPGYRPAPPRPCWQKKLAAPGLIKKKKKKKPILLRTDFSGWSSAKTTENRLSLLTCDYGIILMSECCGRKQNRHFIKTQQQQKNK